MWVARQKSGDLYLFTINEPYRHNGYWENDVELESNYTKLDPSLFPDLKWEDEPIKVSLEEKDNNIKTVIKNTIFHNIRSGKYSGDVWKLYDDILEICG